MKSYLPKLAEPMTILCRVLWWADMALGLVNKIGS